MTSADDESYDNRWREIYSLLIALGECIPRGVAEMLGHYYCGYYSFLLSGLYFSTKRIFPRIMNNKNIMYGKLRDTTLPHPTMLHLGRHLRKKL